MRTILCAIEYCVLHHLRTDFVISFHFLRLGSWPRSSSTTTVDKGGYESLIGNTPLLYLPHLSSLFPNGVKIFVKMESMNPGGTGKDRAALNMILDAERRGNIPPPLQNLHCSGKGDDLCSKRVDNDDMYDDRNDDEYSDVQDKMLSNHRSTAINNQSAQLSMSSMIHSNIPLDIHNAILVALRNTRTNGILCEGTSGSTGISLASLSCSRGHGVIVVMPDDQSSQKVDFLRKLGAGVIVVQNCSISNPGHYVNVARRVYEWLQVERRYDDYYWKHIACNNDMCATEKKDGEEMITSQPPKLIQAVFMNQFENLANVQSHSMTTGPEIYSQLHGNVDAFVMSAGTGGTLVGVGGYLKERWWQAFHERRGKRNEPPRVVLVDPPGSSLFNKIKHGVAYASQQSEQRLRRHRYDTLAEGIGLDRITANFGLGCEIIAWEHLDESKNNACFGSRIDMRMNQHITNNCPSSQHRQALSSTTMPATLQHKQIIDDALSITDQQAVYMAHYLLRHEGLFVGSSTAMNIVGALSVASKMPPNTNVVTVVCDGGHRHTSRFWNEDFITEQGLIWPGDSDRGVNLEDRRISLLELLGIINSASCTQLQS